MTIKQFVDDSKASWECEFTDDENVKNPDEATGWMVAQYLKRCEERFWKWNQSEDTDIWNETKEEARSKFSVERQRKGATHHEALSSSTREN